MLGRTLQLLFILFIISKGYSQSIEVCNSCEVKTLKEAIAKSNAHGEIIVNKGTYLEHDILIDKPLLIIGKNNPIIDGDKKGYVLIVKSDSVTVSGFTIRNPGQSYTKRLRSCLYIT